MKNIQKYREFFDSILKNDRLSAADVGADGGVCSHWLPFLPLMVVDAFDPNEKECEIQSKISPPQIAWNPIGLARKSGTHTLYVPKRTTGASLYPPNPEFLDRFDNDAYWDQVRSVQIECSSYADFLKLKRKKAPNLIKLDTQGSELDILSTFTDEQWKDVICVETEIEFFEIYKGQPLFKDVHEFMVSKGFELLDLRTARGNFSHKGIPNYFLKSHLNTFKPTNALSAQLVAGDALYFKKISGEEVFSSKEFFAKAIICAHMYQYFDLSLWLIERAKRTGFLTEEEANQYFNFTLMIAPKPRLKDRNDFFGKLTRKIRSKLGLSDSMDVYWMKGREWPNL